jgi:CheY-like chemotaxis protein/DNA-binding XRE family transcriptional regulator
MTSPETPDPQLALGAVLKRNRESKGITQEDLAAASGLDRTFISLLERGQRQPTLKTLFSLAAALGVRTSSFIEEVEAVLRGPSPVDNLAHAKKFIMILIAEDDADDRCLIADAFKEVWNDCRLQFVENGRILLDKLTEQCLAAPNELPELILLDLNMPYVDGRQALAEIKADPCMRSIPVVVFTTSRAMEDVHHAYRNGASSYIAKPNSFEELKQAILALRAYWFDLVTLPA